MPVKVKMAVESRECAFYRMGLRVRNVKKDTDDGDHNPLFYVFFYILCVFFLSAPHGEIANPAA
jgi:hypothetical protein